jgi:hypothetical protein
MNRLARAPARRCGLADTMHASLVHGPSFLGDCLKKEIVPRDLDEHERLPFVEPLGSQISPFQIAPSELRRVAEREGRDPFLRFERAEQ